MQTNTTTSEAFGLRIGSIEGHGREVRNGGDTDQVLCLLPILSKIRNYNMFVITKIVFSKIDLYPGGKI